VAAPPNGAGFQRIKIKKLSHARYVLGVFLRYALFLFVLPMFLLRLYAYFAGMAGSEAWARMVWKPLPLWLLGVPVLCAAIHVWRLRSRGIDLSRQDFKPVQAMEATVPTAQKPLFDRLREHDRQPGAAGIYGADGGA
jgi:hypothetical protein